MSRLASRRSKGGPITSTQIDEPTVSNNPGREEYVSREEKIFQRQLESAIEMSRKAAIESASSGSELSQEHGIKSDPIKVVLKRKSIEENYTVTPPRKAKTRKLIISDEDSDDEFVGFEPKKKKSPIKKIEEKKETNKKSNKQSNPVKNNDLARSEQNRSFECEIKLTKSIKNNLENEKPIKNNEIKPNVSNIKSEVISNQADKKSSEQKITKDKGDSCDKRSKLPNKRRQLVVSDDSDSEESSEEEEIVEKKMPSKAKKPIPQPKKPTATINTPKQEMRELEKIQQPTTPTPILGASKPKIITMPKWTPPARIGDKSKDSGSPSPGLSNLSPGFRVGLSRNVRNLKPLHPNVKMVP